MLKAQFEDELKNMAKVSVLLEEKGIDFAGTTEVPNFVFIDSRMNNNAKLLYLLLHSLKDMEDNNVVNHKRIADLLSLNEEEYFEAMDLIRMLGLIDYNEENESCEIVSNPSFSQELLVEKLEELKETLFNTESPKTKNPVKAKVIDGEFKASEGNINQQAFAVIAKEIGENITDEIEEARIKINFKSGVVEVQLGK